MTASVCLTMIVKDEAHVIERCLRSVLPVIDSWVVVDTGSTDGTQQIVREVLGDLPGVLHERPWKNFGHNRTEAINLAKGRADYLLFIDADDTLELPDGFVWPELEADAYQLRIEHAPLSYLRTCLVRGALPWRFEGVLHEYPTTGADVRIETIDGPLVRFNGDGRRSTRSDAEKYADDVRVLTEALRDEPDNSRYVFYLAQSYRDMGDLANALRVYRQRAQMGGWDEEVWYSLFQSAVLGERRHVPEPQIVAGYLEAHQFRPTRAEALTELARYYREHGARYALAYVFAAAAVSIERPADILFLDADTYQWRAQDEYAIACYWTGRYAEAARVGQALLDSPGLPEAQRERIRQNLDFSLDKLAGR